MRIIVNAATLVVGGGVQVGITFIENALIRDEHTYLFLVSKAIYDALICKFESDNRLILIEKSPAHPLNGYRSRKIIKNAVSEFKPDIVYSIGFPSYISFSTFEIGRYTNPWEINPEPLPWHLYDNIVTKVKIKLGIKYRQFWAKKADRIETQTQAAKEGIHKRLEYPLEQIFVVPNSANNIFQENCISDDKPLNDDLIIFCLAAGYPHKNLDIIPFVAKELQDRYGISACFVVTLDEGSELLSEIYSDAKKLNVTDLIKNVGKLDLFGCLEQYSKSKIVFLPTLLEVFSATYLEAMAVGRPIITSDLSFAHDNCGDAALYFKPGDYVDAAKNIYDLVDDQKLYAEQVAKGRAKLNEYPTVSEKYDILFNHFLNSKYDR